MRQPYPAARSRSSPGAHARRVRQYPTRAMSIHTTRRAFVSRPADGARIVNPLGGEITFRLRGEDTDGRLTMFETVVSPGEGPPLHTHANEDECLVVTEGDVRFRLGDELEHAPVGSFVYVPRHVPHTWQNVGTGPARMLVLFTPAGMERFFDRFAAHDVQGPGGFVEAAAGTGMTVVGPPLSESHPPDGGPARGP